MLRSFAGRLLLAAKTSVKEPVKAKNAVKTKEKKVIKVVDTSKFHHNKWRGNSIFQLAKALPRPEKPSFEDKATWLHKNGHGLKFYRPLWTRYPEPCYWTIAKIKLKSGTSVNVHRVWGFLTWRGQTEPVPRPIPGGHRKEWRILLEPGTKLGTSVDNYWTAPEITLESDPKTYTQIPEDLPGSAEGTWPYPWGKLGTRNFPRDPPKPDHPTLVSLAEEIKMDRQIEEDFIGERENWARDYDANMAEEHERSIREMKARQLIQEQRNARKGMFDENEDELAEDEEENEENDENEDEDDEEGVEVEDEEDMDEEEDLDADIEEEAEIEGEEKFIEEEGEKAVANKESEAEVEEAEVDDSATTKTGAQ